MTVRYSDTAGSNTSPYDTWAKAATDPQTIVDLATAGDINYYRGTKTLAAPIDFDTTNGDTTNGYVKHIGCAADGSIDGTKYVLDGNSAATYCIYCATNGNYHWIENFELKNATSHGYYAPSTGDYNVLVNSIAHNNGGDGFYIGSSTATMILCKGYSNTSDGALLNSSRIRLYFCSFYNNSEYGINASTSANSNLLFGCLIHNNTTIGIDSLDNAPSIINCVIDGETTGILIGADQYAHLIGNRITNNTTGVNCNTKLNLAGWNYFHASGTADVSNATLTYNIPYRAALTNHLLSAGIDGTNKVDVDADDGYNDRTNDDFNLKASRTLIRTEIDLEVGS